MDIGNLGGVCLLNYATNKLNKNKGLKTKDHILYQSCQESFPWSNLRHKDNIILMKKLLHTVKMQAYA